MSNNQNESIIKQVANVLQCQYDESSPGQNHVSSTRNIDCQPDNVEAGEKDKSNPSIVKEMHSSVSVSVSNLSEVNGVSEHEHIATIQQTTNIQHDNTTTSVATSTNVIQTKSSENDDNVSMIPGGPSYENDSIQPAVDGRCISSRDVENQKDYNLSSPHKKIMSPKARPNHQVPQSSPTHHDEEKGISHDYEKKEKDRSPRWNLKNVNQESFRSFRKENTTLFPFGKVRTIFPILMSLSAIICSMLCKESTSFVSLGKPVYVDGYENLSELGLFYVKFCRTDEFINNIDPSSGIATIVKLEYAEEEEFIDDMAFFNKPEIISETTFNVKMIDHEKDDQLTLLYNTSTDENDCRKFKLESTLVSDGLWNTVRLLVGYTAAIGFFVTIALVTTIFWKTINLIPISIGMFFTYLCQSFAFLFYDSTACKKHYCYHSRGTSLAVAACICWFSASIGTLIMLLHERNSKHLEKMRDINDRMAKRDTNRVKELYYTQWAFFRIFKNNNSFTSQTPTETSSSSISECDKSKMSI